MVRTSNRRYIIINTQGYENKPAIPIKTENGKLWVLSFMSSADKRFVLIERKDVAQGELTQMKLL